MARWIIEILSINGLLLVTVTLVYIATKPGCNWLFNCKDEYDAQTRLFIRKMSFVAMLILASTMVGAIVLHVVAG